MKRDAAAGARSAGALVVGSRAANPSVFRSNAGAIAVMLAAVGLQVLGAVLLKTIADNRVDWRLAVLAVGVGAVVVLNLVRLVVWGFAHRHFPLSTTFPLSALFFPAMLLVAVGFGDEVGANEVIGALLITGGTFWLTIKVPSA